MAPHTCHRWLLSDPTATLTEILERGGAEVGRTLVAFLEEDTEDVLAVRSLATPSPHWGDGNAASDEAMDELCEQVRAIAEAIAPPRTFESGRWSVMRGSLVTVVCRRGYAVSTADEMQFFHAWRYSNHLTAAFEGDVYVVTPHGWASTLGEQCGPAPALQVLD